MGDQLGSAQLKRINLDLAFTLLSSSVVKELVNASTPTENRNPTDNRTSAYQVVFRRYWLLRIASCDGKAEKSCCISPLSNKQTSRTMAVVFWNRPSSHRPSNDGIGPFSEILYRFVRRPSFAKASRSSPFPVQRGTPSENLTSAPASVQEATGSQRA